MGYYSYSRAQRSASNATRIRQLVYSSDTLYSYGPRSLYRINYQLPSNDWFALMIWRLGDQQSQGFGSPELPVGFPYARSQKPFQPGLWSLWFSGLVLMSRWLHVPWSGKSA